jgi:hydrogenase expression/formation protein HypC
MCLAVPGKIISVSSSGSPPHMAKAEIGGLVREICTDWLPQIKLNDYVMIHAGYALEIIAEDEAKEQIRLLLEVEETIKQKMNQ